MSRDGDSEWRMATVLTALSTIWAGTVLVLAVIWFGMKLLGYVD